MEEINNDIDAIGRLLAENREKINSLRHTAAQKLRKANLRIEGLEKMIADLNGQLAERQSEIEQLRDELSLKDTRVAELTETVAEQSAEVEQLSAAISNWRTGSIRSTISSVPKRSCAMRRSSISRALSDAR